MGKKKSKDTEITFATLDQKQKKDLAKDIFFNRVFGSWMIKDASMILPVFTAVAFEKEETVTRMQDVCGGDKPIHFYESMDKASTRAKVMGMPMFNSYKYMTDDELKEVLEYLNIYKEKINAVEI